MIETVIQPKHIDITAHFFDAFDNHETEVSANWIVRFCQARSQGWEPFTYDELNTWCMTNGHRGDFWFNRLERDGWIDKIDGKYVVTHRFVCRCYEASPSTGIEI